MCHAFLASLQQIFQNPLDAFYMPWYFSCKSHRSCGLVTSHPQDVVVFILNTASPWIIPEKFTAPQHTRSFCRRFTPTKFFACCGAVFFFSGKLHLENFMSRPNVIPAFRQRHCINRGRNFVRGKRRPHYMSRITSTYFLRLNNSETFVELVGARPLHLLTQTVLPLKSPTGAFIAALRFANAVYAF